jgi:hypothetical protein
MCGTYCTGEMQNAQNILVAIPEEKRPIGRPTPWVGG